MFGTRKTLARKGANQVSAARPPAKTGPAAQTGLIVIPDITGYTAFVSDSELDHAQRVIGALLEALIDANRMELQLCEIEGDALLFFRIGDLPPLSQIEAQVAAWHQVFHAKLREFNIGAGCRCGACSQMENLALKVVVHYGEIGFTRVGAARRLFGKDVTLAHRLLKNSLTSREYLLLTQAAFDGSGPPPEREPGFFDHVEHDPVFGAVPTRVLPLAAQPEAAGRVALPWAAPVASPAAGSR